MSGPITRQYGVPNWDDIFGKKDSDESKMEQPPTAESQANKEKDSGTIEEEPNQP